MSFKENILELLSATEYSLNLKQDQLNFFDVHKNLKPLFDWFTLNISQENCITFTELEEFNVLEENGEVLYGEELDKALQVYHDQPVDTLVPYAEAFNETINEEVIHTKEQLHLKTKLLSVLRSSTSAVSDDMCDMSNELRKAEAQHNDVLKDLFALNKVFNIKLMEVKETLNEFEGNLSELVQGNEFCTDEGIDTLPSDKLNCSTWSVSSTASVKFNCSEKASAVNYLCQLPFQMHEKMQKKFCRILEWLSQQAMLKTKRNKDYEMDAALELGNIMERLFCQKLSYITNIAELEGINAARDKVKALYIAVENNTWNPTQSQLRSELFNFEENGCAFEESFDRNNKDLSDVCKKWAEYQTLKPVSDRLEEKIECYNSLIAKMDEITGVMKTKVAADTILCVMLEWEAERVEACVELHTSVQGKIIQQLEATRKRLDIMSANFEDYNDYCALPIEERCEFMEWLAAVFRTDKKNVTQALDIITESSQGQLERLSQLNHHQIQTIISLEHMMKDFYNKEVQRLSRLSEGANHELCVDIQNMLDIMCNEIQDTIIQCQSIQNGGSIEEGNEIQHMLKKLLKYKKNQSDLEV